jgi:hypothetical protein
MLTILNIHHVQQDMEKFEKRIEIVTKKLERMEDMDERVSSTIVSYDDDLK